MNISVKEISYRALERIKKLSPYASGNLHDHGIVWRQTGKGVYEIHIGGSPAPYAVYTNEPWVAAFWEGKPNPNEHWIDKGVQTIVNDILVKTGGKLVSTTGEKERWANKSYWDRQLSEGNITQEQYNTYVGGSVQI